MSKTYFMILEQRKCQTKTLHIFNILLFVSLKMIHNLDGHEYCKQETVAYQKLKKLDTKSLLYGKCFLLL